MKIIAKDTTELCNIIYGDKEDYDYITKNDMDCILDDKIRLLEEIYEYMENYPDKFSMGNSYDIGDIINLVAQYKKTMFAEETITIKDRNLEKILNELEEE